MRWSGSVFDCTSTAVLMAGFDTSVDIRISYIDQ
jgi:hypothetical protein